MSNSLNTDARHESAGRPLATLDQVPEGEVSGVEAVLGGEPASVLLHREGGAVRAWVNVCPHAGRRLDWSPGRFLRTKQGLLVCAAHGATFELSAGECVAGPCRGDSLRAIPVEVRDGAIWLAT